MDTTSTIREILDKHSDGKRPDTCLIGRTKLSPIYIVTLSHEKIQAKESARCLQKLPLQMNRIFRDLVIWLNLPAN